LKLLGMLAQINDSEIEKQVSFERCFMKTIGGGCRFPVAAYAEFEAEKVVFRAIAHKPHWPKIEKVKVEFLGKDMDLQAEELAKQLLAKNEE